jgi:hypothetical protein
MANYKLHLGTQAQFDAKKAAGQLVATDLYFIEDTLVIYKGENLLSASVEAVAEFPASAAQGRIYVNSETLEAKVWNGSAWTVVSPAVETELTADTTAGALVTASAIRNYVAAQTGTAGFVKNVAYDEADQKITLTYADDSTKEIELKDLVTNVAYDADKAELTISKANAEADTTINLPKENFLSAASFDATTNVLTMTLVDGTEVPVNLEELIDVYTGDETATAKVAVSEDNKISATVKVSAEEGNQVEAKEDGLYVAAPAEALIKEIESTNTVALEVEDGKLTADAKISTTENNQLFADAQGLFVAATDLSNYYTKSETYTQDEVDAAILAAHTWEEI